MDFIKDNMIVAPALQAEIISRIIGANFGDTPQQSVHDLGTITLPDGGTARLFERHAADAIITDPAGNVVLITRAHNPGVGKFALPGGFIDEVGGVVETPYDTAIREATEEAGISEALLRDAGGTLLGARRYKRPFDIRCAWSDLAGTAIRKGDFFGISTQGFSFRLPRILDEVALLAGDDASHVQVLRIADLTPDQFAVPDHLEMIRQAMALPNFKGLSMSVDRPPLPPFSRQSAMLKVRAAEDGWNTRNPERVALAYTQDSRWRNRSEFLQGRQAIVEFLARKWTAEQDYRLIKELWAFADDRIAVRFAYEWHDANDSWFRSYGNENWAFDAHGLMRSRHASINDVPISRADRLFHWDSAGPRPADHPELSDLGL